MKLKIGKLYCANSYDIIWKANPEFLLSLPGSNGNKIPVLDTKNIFFGDILLFLKQQNFMLNNGGLCMVFCFLDKDGDELWFKENETYDLEEAK